jgi:hypothetical protein
MKMEIVWGSDIKGEKIDGSLTIEFNETEDIVGVFNRETDILIEFEEDAIWFDCKIIED